MKKLACTVAALFLGLLATSQASANLLTNGGFEDPITFDGPPFVGSWEGFSGSAGASTNIGVGQSRTGFQHLDLSILNTNNTFTGVFQDVPGLTSGTSYTFSGWNLAYSSPLDLRVEVRIEWRNSVTNQEISRTTLAPVLSSSYSMFSLLAAAPAGADLARVVYAIDTFGPEATNSGRVFVDDLSFDVAPVPLPAAAWLLLSGLAGLGYVGRRKAN